MNKSCPYGNWTSVAKFHCTNPDLYHCVKDEYGRIGWLCTRPIWVKEDQCPVYNTDGKELDIKTCPQTKCPPYLYKSNNISVEYACRYVKDISSTTNLMPSSPDPTAENKINLYLIIFIFLAMVLFVIGIVTGFVRYKRRQKTPQNMDMGLEETNDLFGENNDTCTSNKAEKKQVLLIKPRNS